MTETLLSVRDLVVSYGNVPAVKGISLEVRDGEAVALLGPNGAGKSSTLRALSRMMKATGSIEFMGQDITGIASDKAARLGLVHVPEGRKLFPPLTAEENLLVGQTARGSRAPIYSLSDIYDLFPLLPALRKRSGWQLSGGEQQMVAIGRGLLAAPRVLRLDEPALGRAPRVGDTVYRA
ncbi:MAG: ABC transporter ATP-binding protein, partial [Acidimicrobiia bacterium]